jgi:hypothetical protein
MVAQVERHPGELYRFGRIVANLARVGLVRSGCLQLTARRSTGPKRERARSSGSSGHAARSPPTQSPFSFVRWPTTSTSSLGRWRCPRRRNRGADQLPEKPIKIGAKVVSHGLYLTFQMTEVAV